MALVQGARVVRLLRRLSTSRPAGEEHAAEAEALARTMKVRHPRFVVVPGKGSPLFWSAGRPLIALPEDLVNSLDLSQVRSVLAHELAHLKRRDHWVRWLELAACCVWWWNPLFWFVRGQLHEAAELSCDAWVLNVLPEERRTYAQTLVTVSEWVSRRALPGAALGMGAGVRLVFERRLKMILRERVPHRVTVPVLLCVCLIGLAALPGWSQDKPKPPAEPASPVAETKDTDTPALPAPVLPAPAEEKEPVDPELAAALQSPVSIEFENEHVTNILGFISEYVGINIAVDYRVVKPPAGKGTEPASPLPSDGYSVNPIIPAINLRDIALQDALRAMLTAMDLDFRAEPGFIWVSTPERIKGERFPEPELPPEAKDSEIAKALESPVSIDFTEEHVANVLQFISDYVGINIAVDYRAVPPPKRASEDAAEEDLTAAKEYAITGIVHHVRMEDIALKQALKALLRPSGLYYKVEPGYIWVSTPERLGMERFAEGPWLPADRVAAPPQELPMPSRNTTESLKKKISLEFADAHISQIVEGLGRDCGINIVVDNRVVAPVNASAASGQYVTDGMIVSIKLHDVSLKEALQALTKPLGLAYGVQESFVWITTPLKLRTESFEKIETRYYDLGATRSEEIDPLMQQLGRLMPPVFDPKTEQELSYLRYEPEKNRLAVRNVPANLAVVEDFLDALDQLEQSPQDASVSRRLSSSPPKQGGLRAPSAERNGWREWFATLW